MDKSSQPDEQEELDTNMEGGISGFNQYKTSIKVSKNQINMAPETNQIEDNLNEQLTDSKNQDDYDDNNYEQ